jgi:hypothetical protein
MPKARKTKTRRAAKPLYHSAKISDYIFHKILLHFVRDHTATETARDTRLSVAAIFTKLRVYFTEAGLFSDPGKIGMFNDNEEFEMRFLEFHIGRLQEKRGLRSANGGGPDYHICESHWRFHFYVLMIQRPSETIHAMMLSHLLGIIRICGPVGIKPINQKGGLLAVFRQMDQRILWLQRNARDYSSLEVRRGLREIHSIKPFDPHP